MSEESKAVAKGARLLDEKLPDWYKTEFNWETFDIDNVEECMLGQLVRLGAIPKNGTWYCSYSVGKEFLGLDGAGTTSVWGYASGQMNKARIKTEWQNAVNVRLNGVNETTAEHGFSVTLNPTERQLLIDMLEVREYELLEEKDKLKPQYREFLDPALMTTRALLVAVRA